MPAAAEPQPLSLPPAPPGDPLAAALAADLDAGPPRLDSAADRHLVAELIGARSAALVASVPLARLLEAGDEQLARLGLPPADRRTLLAGAELARRFQPSVGPAGPRPGPRQFLPQLADLRAAAVEVLAVLSLDGGLGVAGPPSVVAGGA